MLTGSYFLPFKISDDFTVEMKPRKEKDAKPVEVTMVPEVWGEAYQDKGTWKATIDRSRISEPRDLDVLIKYQDILVTTIRVQAWDDDMYRPGKEELSIVKKKLEDTKKQLTKANNTISKMKNSKSWKLPQPLRKMSGHE